MTWPNWNWESIETVAIIIGGLVLLLSYNRWMKKLSTGTASHSSKPLGSQTFALDDGEIFGRSLSQDTTNLASGLPMIGGMDICGNPQGCDYRNN